MKKKNDYKEVHKKPEPCRQSGQDGSKYIEDLKIASQNEGESISTLPLDIFNIAVLLAANKSFFSFFYNEKAISLCDWFIGYSSAPPNITLG